MKKDIWIFAETHTNNVHPVTYQLITKAKSISNDKKVIVILMEDLNNDFIEKIKEYGPDEIIHIKNESLTNARDSLYADILEQLTKINIPNTILFGSTVIGRSVSARLQAKLNTGLTADCLDLKFEDDLLVQTKPSYGDNIMCEIICPKNYPQMATVRPNIFIAKKEENNTIINKVENIIFTKDERINIKDEKLIVSKGNSIATADRVVAIGRGASDEESISLVKELTKKIGAKLGVTRPLTDLKHFSNDDQIGQSGISISPRLLINLGINGAVQFTSGIKKSELIISINNNKNAPIINESDYYFIGDAKEFLKQLLKVIQ